MLPDIPDYPVYFLPHCLFLPAFYDEWFVLQFPADETGAVILPEKGPGYLIGSINAVHDRPGEGPCPCNV